MHELHFMQLDIPVETCLAFMVQFLALEGVFKVGDSLKEFLSGSALAFSFGEEKGS